MKQSYTGITSSKAFVLKPNKARPMLMAWGTKVTEKYAPNAVIIRH